MKKCLVVGGAGFLGANLVRKLRKLGYKVFVFQDVAANMWRIADQVFFPDLQQFDLTDYNQLQERWDKIMPDHVFNMLDYGCQPYHQDVDRIYQQNFLALHNLLRVACSRGFESFVSTGSHQEYGVALSGESSEDWLLHPESDYGVAKACASQLLTYYAKKTQLPIFLVRPFCVYGEYMSPYSPWGQFFFRLISGQEAKLRCSWVSRDFVFVHDVLNLYILLMQAPVVNNPIFNVGTGHYYSLLELITLCKQLFGAQHSNFSYEDYFQQAGCAGNSNRLVADLGHVEKCFDWKVKYPLQEGLLLTYQWYAKNLHLYTSYPSIISRVEDEASCCLGNNHTVSSQPIANSKGVELITP